MGNYGSKTVTIDKIGDHKGSTGPYYTKDHSGNYVNIRMSDVSGYNGGSGIYPCHVGKSGNYDQPTNYFVGNTRVYYANRWIIGNIKFELWTSEHRSPRGGYSCFAHFKVTNNTDQTVNSTAWNCTNSNNNMSVSNVGPHSSKEDTGTIYSSIKSGSHRVAYAAQDFTGEIYIDMDGAVAPALTNPTLHDDVDSRSIYIKNPNNVEVTAVIGGIYTDRITIGANAGKSYSYRKSGIIYVYLEAPNYNSSDEVNIEVHFNNKLLIPTSFTVADDNTIGLHNDNPEWVWAHCTGPVTETDVQVSQWGYTWLGFNDSGTVYVYYYKDGWTNSDTRAIKVTYNSGGGGGTTY